MKMRFSGNDHDNECSRAQTKEIKDLRANAKVMESRGDITAAEQSLLEALQVDPLDVKTLACFAAFLHTKKGYLFTIAVMPNTCSFSSSSHSWAL